MAKRRANSEGSIYHRKDGRWAASLSLGRTKRKHFLGHTRAEVSAQLTAALNDQQQGVPVVSNRQNVSQYLAQWLETMKKSVRPRSYEAYDPRAASPTSLSTSATRSCTEPSTKP